MSTLSETENLEAASSQASPDGAGNGATADSSTKPEGAAVEQRETAEASTAGAEAKDEGRESKDEGQQTKAKTDPKNISEALQNVKLEEPEGEVTEPATAANAEKADKTGAAKDEGGKGESADSADVPFQQRKEWQSLKTITGENFAKVKPVLRELLGRETHLRQQLREVEPSHKAVSEFKQLTGGEDGYKNMTQIVRDYAHNPDKAVPVLEQMLADARQRAGFEVVSDDLKPKIAKLKEQLDNDLIRQEDFDSRKAELVEIEKSRAQAKRAQNQLQETEAQRQQRDSEQASSAAAQTLNRWEENIRERDPDFGVVTDVEDAKHGESIADQVFDAVCLKQARLGRSLTGDELVKEAQRVYGQARGRLPQPGGREQRVVTSIGSSVTAKPKPRNLREAMDHVKLEG